MEKILNPAFNCQKWFEDKTQICDSQCEKCTPKAEPEPEPEKSETDGMISIPDAETIVLAAWDAAVEFTTNNPGESSDEKRAEFLQTFFGRRAVN